MLRMKKILLFAFMFACLIGQAISQNKDGKVIIPENIAFDEVVFKEVLVAGNKLTKDHYITRELDFKPGDTLSLVYSTGNARQKRRALRDSSELVLRAVDLVFKRDDASKGVTSEVQPEVRHLPIRKGEQGLVEIWDLERGRSDDDVQHWAPKSGEIVDPPHLVMARRIATTIANWTQTQSPEMLKENRPGL